MNQPISVPELDQIPSFCEGIQYFSESLPDIDRLGDAPVLSASVAKIADPSDEKAVYQTLLAADALRYLTLQVTAAKSGAGSQIRGRVTSWLRLGNVAQTSG